MADMNPQPVLGITDDDKLWALLSWIFSPIVPIIVLLLEDKKVRPFIKYNAIQALVVSVVGYAISAILSAVSVWLCSSTLSTWRFSPTRVTGSPFPS